MKPRIMGHWQRLEPWQQIVGAAVLFIIANVCLFLVAYGCAWLMLIYWISNLSRRFP